MSAIELLTDLRKAGATVSVTGDKLRLEAPRGVLTEDLKQRLLHHKADLIRLLDETTTAYREGPPYPDGWGRVKCFYCSNCEITGRKAGCRVSRKSVSGIALLIECSNFTMKTIH